MARSLRECKGTIIPKRHPMVKIILKTAGAAALAFLICSCSSHELHIKTDAGTSWWVGVINRGYMMPYHSNGRVDLDLYAHTDGNQVQPLLLSDRGDVIWSDYPPKVTIRNGEVMVDAGGKAVHSRAGSTLKEAYEFASEHYFPPSGKTPDLALISAPQYNTWIELIYDQNQEDILAYARAILDNGYPPGVLMIDDNWQEDYGKWNFHPGRFPDPHMMMDSLHRMGFKVMLWVCPFVSPDCDVYRRLNAQGVFMQHPPEPGEDAPPYTAMVTWWNGVSAELDLTNPKAREWLYGELDRLVDDYGVDGFKLDAGDPFFYKGLKAFRDILPDEHTMLWGEVGLRYPLNEYRAMYKMGGQPLVERLRDKYHDWEDVRKLIPNMLLQGINGYVFGCPDMIGGGDYSSFINVSDSLLDQELIVRSAQIHALMPMMQFSVAPWRVLDESHRAAVHKAVETRMEFTPLILRLSKEAAATNQPVIRYLEYCFPHRGYAGIKDQFMLGDSVLVAPVVEKNAFTRNVILPDGTWRYLDGTEYTGPSEAVVDAPLDVLPYFILADS